MTLNTSHTFQIAKHGLFAILLAVLLPSFFHDLSARHIIGGEMTYECLGQGSTPDLRNYLITMKVYRDCSSNGAEFDDPAEIGLYQQATSGLWSFIDVYNVNHNPVIGIDPSRDNPCLIIPPDVCVEEAVYEFELTDLPVIDGDYRLAYRRCCRNNTIANIIEPESSGATFGVNLTSLAQQECNSSPTFDDFPPIVICAGEDIDFDHAASDVDGDQLVYEFCAPQLGGGNRGSFDMPGDPRACDGITPDPARCLPTYPPVNYVVPTYSPTAPMAGDPVVDINPATGLISGVPEITGQFVVGVCVREFRAGVEISRIQRDFQFNVAICEPTVVAAISADTVTSTRVFSLSSCGSATIDFENLSGNTAFIREYLWEFYVDSDTLTRSERNISFTFPDTGNYRGIMAVNPGTDCADTAILDINIFPEITAAFDFDYDTCVAGPVSFTDLSTTGAPRIESWRWTLDDTLASTEQDPIYTFETPGLKDLRLAVVDNNGCADDTVATILYQPAPALVVLNPDRFVGCAPGSIFFDNLSTPIDSTYDIMWTFGDGGTSDEISPTHFYEDPGVYTITVDITSPIGCTASAEFVDFIRVLPGPIAAFTFDPLNPTRFASFVQFTDLSQDAVSWQWLFGDESASFEQNPSYTFQDTGVQEIILIAAHPSGCTDSARAIIDIQPVVTYFLPNAFTPNNDGLNDTYKGTGAVEDLVSFRMTVWNRWGELIYEGTDPLQGWNGRKRNVGEDSPPGVYSVFVEYTEPRGKQVVLESVATLIR